MNKLLNGFLIMVLILDLLYIIYYVNTNNKKTVELHNYDYVLEVNGDSIPKYSIYDIDHRVVAKEILASQLDSVIISDNQ